MKDLDDGNRENGYRGGILVLGFFVSGFLAWRPEFEKNHPGLSISIDELGFLGGITVNKDPEPSQYIPSAAFVEATVRNLGLESVVDNYALTITIPGRAEPIKPLLVAFTFPKDKDAFINFPGDRISFDKMLYRLTATPIENGDEKQGVLFFEIPGEQKALTYLNQKGTTFVLTCNDVSGNLIKTVVTSNGVNEPHRHYIRLE